MTTYAITRNDTFGSHEVEFDSKPQVAIIAALKALKMRWNPKRSIWYGFVDESKIREAIQAAQPESVPAQIVEDGYLGAVAVSGAKSNRRLYGSDLSAAVRADIKAAGIKGVTVRCESYSGGQSLKVTIKATSADIVPMGDYISAYAPNPGSGWIYLSNCEHIHVTDYWNLEASEQENTRVKAATYAYECATNPEFRHNINQYHIDKYSEYTAAFLRKIKAVNEIIANYRYDNSNSQVDYFDTNFYYDLYVNIKPDNQ